MLSYLHTNKINSIVELMSLYRWELVKWQNSRSYAYEAPKIISIRWCKMPLIHFSYYCNTKSTNRIPHLAKHIAKFFASCCNEHVKYKYIYIYIYFLIFSLSTATKKYNNMVIFIYFYAFKIKYYFNENEM